VATAGFLGEILIWKADDGTVVNRLAGHSQAVWSTGWSADGKTIAWGNSGKRGQKSQFHPLERTFNVQDLEWGEAPGSDFQQARESAGSSILERTEFNRVLTIKNRDGQPLHDLKFPKDEGFVACYTWIGKDRVVLGTNLSVLCMFDANAGEQVRRFLGHSGDLQAIAPSPDDRYFLSGSADHTLRIWNIEQTEPLLSLFFGRDDWIAWTPQGYYAASDGGERLMGWQVNNGVDKMATFHAAAQFRKSFYRPDVIKLLLKTGSVEKALARMARLSASCISEAP
jgi:WD40 repeat protein